MKDWELDRLTAAHIALDEAMVRLGYENPADPPPCALTALLKQASRELFSRCLRVDAGQYGRISDIRDRLDAAFPATAPAEH